MLKVHAQKLTTIVTIAASVKIDLKALPDWMLRCEKWQSASLLGHSGPRRTRVRLRSSFGRAYASANASVRPLIDDAKVDSKMCIQSGKVLRVLWTRRCSLGDGAGLQGLTAEVVLLVVIDEILHTLTTQISLWRACLALRTV